MTLEHSPTLYTELNSKWIKDLIIMLDAIKLLEENTGRTLFDINHNKIFLDPLSRVMKIRTKINKWDLIKLKSFCTATELSGKSFHSKENHKQNKKATYRMEENICK